MFAHLEGAKNRLQNKNIAIVTNQTLDLDWKSKYYFQYPFEIYDAHARAVEFLGTKPNIFSTEQFLDLCNKDSRADTIYAFINLSFEEKRLRV